MISRDAIIGGCDEGTATSAGETVAEQVARSSEERASSGTEEARARPCTLSEGSGVNAGVPEPGAADGGAISFVPGYGQAHCPTVEQTYPLAAECPEQGPYAFYLNGMNLLSECCTPRAGIWGYFYTCLESWTYLIDTCLRDQGGESINQSCARLEFDELSDGAAGRGEYYDEHGRTYLLFFTARFEFDMQLAFVVARGSIVSEEELESAAARQPLELIIAVCSLDGVSCAI